MKLKGRRIYKGVAEGEAIVTKDGVSFYGGVDPDTGKAADRADERVILSRLQMSF